MKKKDRLGIVVFVIIFLALITIIAGFFFIINKEPQFCGGISGISCPLGYSCVYEGNYPDAGGVCEPIFFKWFNM
jgi:hypothetical protein